MSDDSQQTNDSKSGLPGILKFSFAIAVMLVAGLAILLVTGNISKETFNDYLVTLITVIAIGTVAAALIAFLSGPGKS